MASNFSANQYDSAFSAKSLCNWQVPHWYPKYPQKRTNITQFISNDRGHLLPNVERPKSSSWGHFKSTWELPNIITRQHAHDLSAPQVGNSRWTLPGPNKKKAIQIERALKIKQEKNDEDNRAESSELMRSLTPFENEDLKHVVEENTKRKFNEKEKLNDPIAISKYGKRVIRHETLERDNDLH